MIDYGFAIGPKGYKDQSTNPQTKRKDKSHRSEQSETRNPMLYRFMKNLHCLHRTTLEWHPTNRLDMLTAALTLYVQDFSISALSIYLSTSGLGISMGLPTHLIK
uniref:Transposase n=1 Tax=Heterorhabditis bacteriophora TaxID=37862 RepID=A0A1I7X269_HETBA